MKFLLITVLFVLGGLFHLPSNASPAAEALENKVIVVPVSGTVNASLSAFISRVIRESRECKECVLVFEMDTYGGEVDAAFTIVDTIINATNIETVAFVKTKAISAGALIALACNKMVMKRNTTIGDVAPLMQSNEGPKMLGEKFQSPIRAKFRTLAMRNGYSPVLAESMVSDAMTVIRVTLPDTVIYVDSTAYAELPQEVVSKIVEAKTVVKKNELLTMDDNEAYAFGFSRGSVQSLEELITCMGYSGYEVIRKERSWSETLVAIIAKIAPILMMLGFAALYIEIRTPGFGVPGVLGITCLLLVFLSQYMVGLADYTELLLFAIGLVLLAMEVFVLPGFGIAGITGIMVILIAMVLSMQGFVIPRPDFPWEKQLLLRNLIYGCGSLLGSTVLIVLFFRFLFPKLGKMVSGPYLHASLKDAHADTNTEWILHVGDRGTAVTALRPSGKAELHGMLHDVVSDGVFVEKGEPIAVTLVSGNRIVVGKET